MPAALPRIRVLDLSRVFAGPWCAQMLADFGADVIKVERPVRGDDVRHQGFRVKDTNGADTGETSSFIAMNRGKRSITVDMSVAAGQALIRDLAAHSDVLIENFKAGDLARYELDYLSLSALNPRLVYCSITGFGQTGPSSHLPGYDPLFQSMSGLMSITGNAPGEPGDGPVKVGYSVSDINAGMYSAVAILAALHHRDTISGQGQHIDVALLDAQMAAHSHIAVNYLVSGVQPERTGTGSQITSPYQAFECNDGYIMIAVGNDAQFVQFCEVLSRPELARDARFVTNPLRARNQKALAPLLAEPMRARSVKAWMAVLEAANVPCGPINDFQQAFDDPQIQHRQVLREMPHPCAGRIPIIANPIHFSATPIEYRRAPPLLGQQTREVLHEVLGLSDDAIDALLASKVV